MKKTTFIGILIITIAFLFSSCAGGGGNDEPVVTSENVPGYLQFVYPDGTRAQFEIGLMTDDPEYIELNHFRENYDTLFDLTDFVDEFGLGEHYIFANGYSVNDIPPNRELLFEPFATFLLTKKITITQEDLTHGKTIKLSEFPNRYKITGQTLEGEPFKPENSYMNFITTAGDSWEGKEWYWGFDMFAVGKTLYFDANPFHRKLLINNGENGNYILNETNSTVSTRGNVINIHFTPSNTKEYTLDYSELPEGFSNYCRIFMWTEAEGPHFGYWTRGWGSWNHMEPKSDSFYVSETENNSCLELYSGYHENSRYYSYRLRINHYNIGDGDAFIYNLQDLKIRDDVGDVFEDNYHWLGRIDLWMGEIIQLEGKENTQFSVEKHDGEEWSKTFNIDVLDPNDDPVAISTNPQNFQFDIETTGTYQVDFELGVPFVSLDKSFTFEITE